MEDNWMPTEKSKPKDFLKKQGFYVVLFLCLLIVGTAIVLTALPQNGEEPAAQETDDGNAAVETRRSEDETLQNKATPLPTATPAPTIPVATPTPSAKPTAGTSTVKKGVSPVDGSVVWTFAVDQLLYSRTLDQWTTHAGVDIAAELGAEVRAVLSGTVDEVYEDDALGWTVTIAHTNGRMSLYANLDPSVPVAAGQKLNAGDPVGKVGASSVSECGEVSHLHFGFFVDEKPVNPLEHVVIPH